MEHIAINITVFLVLGAFVGLLSGLLGIGGGVIIMPALAAIFHYSHFPSRSIIHIAAATSLAVMAFSMIRALLAHRRYDVEYWSVFRHWMLPLALGSLSGVVAAHYLHSQVLVILLVVVLSLMSIKMLLPAAVGPPRSPPKQVAISASGSLIGLMSGMLGIGGGTLVLAYLSHYHLEMRRAVVVAIASSLTVALIGTVIAIVMGWHRAGLPSYTIGYVYWPAWIGLVVGSFLCIPLGVKLSHRLPVEALTKIFAIVLLLTAIYLLVRTYD